MPRSLTNGSCILEEPTWIESAGTEGERSGFLQSFSSRSPSRLAREVELASGFNRGKDEELRLGEKRETEIKSEGTPTATGTRKWNWTTVPWCDLVSSLLYVFFFFSLVTSVLPPLPFWEDDPSRIITRPVIKFPHVRAYLQMRIEGG